MATQVQSSPPSQHFLDNYIPPDISVYVMMAWNLIIALGSLFAAYSIATRDNFYNLGDPVQYFVVVMALIPMVVALIAIYHLQNKNPMGRLLSMGLNYVGAVLAFIYLLHLWDFFTGMDTTASKIFENRLWLWGFAVSYFVYWLLGRFEFNRRNQFIADRIVIGIAMLSAIGLLINADIMNVLGDVLAKYGDSTTWIITIVIGIFSFVAYRAVTMDTYFGESPEQRVAWQGWLLLSPNIIGFMIFFAGPLLFSLYLSFTTSPPQQTPEFVALENYAYLFDIEFQAQEDLSVAPQRALSQSYKYVNDFQIGDTRYVIGARDDGFWYGITNTIIFAMLLVPLSVVPALLIASILNSQLAGMKIFRSIYFLPSVAAVVGVGVIWRDAMYGSIVGYINFFIANGVDFLNATLGTAITNPRIVWLQDAKIISMVIMAAWQIVGFNTVLYLAGLQGIPKTLYEAAEVDGASIWNKFRFVTFPLLAPTTFFVVVTTLINGLQVFNEPYVLFGDDTANDGLTAVFYLHRATFTGSPKGGEDAAASIDFGYAASVAWVLFVIIFIITLIQFRVQQSNPYED